MDDRGGLRECYKWQFGMTRAGMTETAFVIIINVTNGMAGTTNNYEWQLAVGLLTWLAYQL